MIFGPKKLRGQGGSSTVVDRQRTACTVIEDCHWREDKQKNQQHIR